MTRREAGPKNKCGKNLALSSFSVTFASMETTKKIATTSAKIMSSLFLGGAILYWMYRDFDFSQIKEVLLHGMNWTWMLLSFPFGILAQMFRGWRWHRDKPLCFPDSSASSGCRKAFRVSAAPVRGSQS